MTSLSIEEYAAILVQICKVMSAILKAQRYEAHESSQQGRLTDKRLNLRQRYQRQHRKLVE
jgi:hypothetical protein